MVNCNDLQKSESAPRYLIKRPQALQWFHNGKLVKHSAEERQAGRFELFLDLLYVALVANFADNLVEHPDGVHLVKYVLIFAPAWYIWADLREIMNSYYTDDLIQRLVVLWIMALLVLYANNAPLIGEEGGETEALVGRSPLREETGVGDGASLTAIRTTVAAYMCARFTAACVFIICSFASYQHRVQSRIWAFFMLTGLVFCIPLFFDEESVSTRAKIAIVAVMIVWQDCTWAFSLSPWLKRRLKLTYGTAVDMAHEIDRMAGFFIIILGEFVYSVVVGNPAAVGVNGKVAKAVFTLIIAFCLNWIYVSGDGSLRATHPIRRSAFTAFLFFVLHMPLSAAFLAGGHVCATTTSKEVLEDGERWLLGGGLAVGMFCLWVLGMIFRCDDQGELLLPKCIRVGMRLVVAIILAILPETHDDLSALQFLAVVMALVGVTVLWETIGGLMKDACLFESWDNRHPPKDNVGSDREGLA